MIIRKIVKTGVITALLLGIFLFYFFSVLTINLNNTYFLDLPPQPDNTEYFAAAKMLYTEHIYAIQLGELFLPPRYPPLYSILMQPLFHLIDDTNHIFIPFLMSYISSAVVIILVMLYLIRYHNIYVAIIAGYLLVMQPSFIAMSRSGLSETTSLIFVLIYFFLCNLAMRKRRLNILWIAAIWIGLATNLRVQLITLTPLIFFSSLFLLYNTPHRFKRLIWVNSIGALLFLLGASPMLVYNWRVLGSPIYTGYQFHLPTLSGLFGSFNFDYLISQISLLGNEFLGNNNFFDVSDLFGTHVYYTPFFFILAIWATIWWGSQHKRNYVFMCSVLIFFLFNLLYFFVSLRLYFIIGILVIIPISMMLVDYLLKNPLRWKSHHMIALSLFFLTLVGYPYLQSGNLGESTLLSVELINPDSVTGTSHNYNLIQALNSRDDTSDSIIFTDMDSVYANSLLSNNSIAIPVSLVDTNYALLQYYGLFDNDELEESFNRYIQNGKSIFYASVQDSSLPAVLTSPQEYAWVLVPLDTAIGKVYKLEDQLRDELIFSTTFNSLSDIYSIENTPTKLTEQGLMISLPSVDDKSAQRVGRVGMDVTVDNFDADGYTFDLDLTNARNTEVWMTMVLRSTSDWLNAQICSITVPSGSHRLRMLTPAVFSSENLSFELQVRSSISELPVDISVTNIDLSTTKTDITELGCTFVY